jgi:uncharacterized protein YrrD
MKLSELKGKPVVSVDEARKLGIVHDVLVDPSYSSIAGLQIKAEGRGHAYVVANEHIRGIGPDAVTVVNKDALQVPDRAQTLAGLPTLGTILGSRVVTEGGALLGSITEVAFDVGSRRILAIEYGRGGFEGLLGRHRSLSIGDIVGVGPGLVTVREVSRAKEQGR